MDTIIAATPISTGRDDARSGTGSSAGSAKKKAADVRTAVRECIFCTGTGDEGLFLACACLTWHVLPGTLPGFNRYHSTNKAELCILNPKGSRCCQ